jgi:Xaa-Pro aminopeptidase
MTQSVDAHAVSPEGLRAFSPAEHDRRVARARELMAADGLDALLVTSEPNFRYFTGFHSQTWLSPTRPRYFVLPLAGEPIAIVPTSNVVGMRESSWVKDLRAWQAPCPEDDGLSLLTDALKSACGKHRRIGAELGPETRLGMPVRDFLRLGEALAPLAFVDGSGLFRTLRMVKSPDEVARIRKIALIASDAFIALPRRIAAGDSERDVGRKLQSDLILRGADKTPYVVCESGPGGYDKVMMGPGDRCLGRGDLLFIDTGSTFDGYWCDFDRHFAFGPPSDDIRRAYDLVYRATDAGIAAVRPGQRACDVWRAMAATLEGAGVPGSIVGRMGHGLGLVITEPPSLNATDETELRAGMVITIEPSLAFRATDQEGSPTKLMLHEENVVVTEDGCSLLSRRSPREIPVVA